MSKRVRSRRDRTKKTCQQVIRHIRRGLDGLVGEPPVLTEEMKNRITEAARQTAERYGGWVVGDMEVNNLTGEMYFNVSLPIALEKVVLRLERDKRDE